MIKDQQCFVSLLCGIFLIYSAAAPAQQKDSDVMKFSASIYAEYSDNRDSKPDGESNFDTYIKPRVDINIEGEHNAASLDFHYAPYYRYRSNPSEIENNTELFHDLGLYTTYQLSPVLGLRLQENFYKTSDPAVDKNGITQRRDSSYMLNHFDVGASYQLSNRRTTVDISGRDNVKRFDDAVVASESDEDNIGASLTVWHQAIRTLALLVVLDDAEFSYDSSRGIERGFTAISAGAGLEKILSKTLSFNLRGGIIAANYRDSSVESDSKPFVSLNVNMDNSPTRIDLALAYLLRDSEVYPFPSENCTQFTTRLEWDSSKLLMFGLSGTYRMAEFSAETLTPEGLAYQAASEFELEGDKNTFIAQIDANYAIGVSTYLKLAQSHENVDSDVSDTYTRNATSLMLTHKF